MTEQAISSYNTTQNGASPDLSGHEGSASLNLSGRWVLAAWIISILVHLFLLIVIGGLRFPFLTTEGEPDLPVAQAEIVGPLHSTAFVPPPPQELVRSKPAKTPQAIRSAPREFVKLSELTTTKKPDLSIIGIGAGGGDFSDFRIPMDASVSSEFFGLGRSARGARRIVYVVDRSGSMIDSFGFVRDELKRSISALRRSQKFHVIFFNSGPPLENPPQRLVSAIAAQKQQFFDFLKTVFPRGDTKPGRALQRALSLEPDLIYLLSDGIDFRLSLMERLNEWNGKRRTKIYTIAYLDQSGSETLERIAREHNGEFKFVTENDLP